MQGVNARYSIPFAEGGEVSPQDMVAEMIAHGVTPQHFANGGQALSEDQFARIIELAKQQPGYLKNAAHKTLGVAGKVFDKLNPAFQVMAALDTGERGINAIERANQGDYRGAAISGLGAIGSGIGMLPGGVPQFLSIPATMGADYLQEHYDETDPHESRFSLKNTTLNK